MAGRLDLKQLSQSGAQDGQIPVWSSAGSIWRPGTVVGGSSTTKSVEVDFGTIQTKYKTFTIVDAAVSASSKIMVTQSGQAATGGHVDDAEMDPIIFSARPGNGQFVLAARALDGVVVGKYVVNYQAS
jgi:hypothetical protein